MWRQELSAAEASLVACSRSKLPNNAQCGCCRVNEGNKVGDGAGVSDSPGLDQAGYLRQSRVRFYSSHNRKP